jgi:diadenosine tetraphosphate (Ap4A) HIT family hydrolase
MKNTETANKKLVYEDDQFIVEGCKSCPLLGYLILRVKGDCRSMADLDTETAGRLGLVPSMATKAIHDAVQPKQIHCLAFSEADPELHFHLFPRTQWLLSAYQESTRTSGEPVDAPRLFQWARSNRWLEGEAGLEGWSGSTAVSQVQTALSNPLPPTHRTSSSKGLDVDRPYHSSLGAAPSTPPPQSEAALCTLAGQPHIGIVDGA